MIYPVELSCHLGGGEEQEESVGWTRPAEYEHAPLSRLTSKAMDSLEALSRDTQERTFCKWCSAPSCSLDVHRFYEAIPG
jgi:hypothetical protein